MPIVGAAKRVENEFKDNPNIIEHIKENKLKKGKKGLVQVEILKDNGVADEDLNKFEDPEFWLTYFPPYAKSDLEKLGEIYCFQKVFYYNRETKIL